MFSVFFFNDTATPEIYTLSLHDALPIWELMPEPFDRVVTDAVCQCIIDDPHEFPLRIPGVQAFESPELDRKSTRLNSSHPSISYAVFCLKKKKSYTTEHLS